MKNTNCEAGEYPVRGEAPIPFVDADYDTDNWFKRVKGLEWEPERGARCTACFDMRFERTALYAHEHGFPVITSCLGISRWKNMDQINASGVRAAGRYPGMTYWEFNWRKKGGAHRMLEISKEGVLHAGILRLHLLAARHQQVASHQRKAKDRTWCRNFTERTRRRKCA